jgi:hypothetical protein
MDGKLSTMRGKVRICLGPLDARDSIMRRFAPHTILPSDGTFPRLRIEFRCRRARVSKP